MTKTLRPFIAASGLLLLMTAVSLAQGTYSAPARINTSLSPSVVRHGDVDGDGDLDLVVAVNATSVLEVYKNDGTGAFSFFSSASLAPGFGPVAMVLARLDGDTDLDVAVANGFSNSVAIMVNDGVGHFALAANHVVGQAPLAITAGDIDNDGDVDLVTANYNSNNVTLLLNLGTGTFGVGTSPFIGARPSSCLLMDLENDGDLDFLIVLSGFNAVVVYQNTGTTFIFDAAYPTGALPFDLIGVDVNFSGRRDLVLACTGSNEICVLTDTGTRGFNPPVFYPVPRRPVRVTATQSDYALGVDLAVTTWDGFKVWLFRNTGNGGFVYDSDRLVGANPASIVSADFNGDRYDDFATANFRGHDIAIFFNQPPAIPYPGTQEDLVLGTGINGPTSSGPGQYIKFGRPSDSLLISLDSPGGSFDFSMAIIGAQLFFPGFPPLPPLPGFYLNSFVFGAVLVAEIPALPSAGFVQFAFVPPGLTGMSVMLQGAALTSLAANGVLATTDGYELRFVN